MLPHALSLKSYTPLDEADFLTLFSDPRVLAHSSTRPDPETSQRLFAKLMEFQQTPPSKPFFIWKICQAERMIGHAELKWTESCAEDELEIVYFFLPEVWGQGFATEICRHLVQHAHHQLGKSVIATVDIDHPSSHRVLQKSGFSECEIRQDEAGDFYFFRAKVNV